MSVFYDTSSLLASTHQDLLSEHFYISSITFKELEEIKVNPHKSPELKYRARDAVRFLDKHRDEFTVVFCNDSIAAKCSGIYFMPTSNDNLILTCASETSCDIVYSEDLCMRITGRDIFDLNMSKCKAAGEDAIYKGYKIFSGDDDEFIVYMSQLDKSKWYANEYLIFENTETGATLEMRYNGTEFVDLKLPPVSCVRAKNPLQRCALDLLFNDDIGTVALLGTYGSGKTYLAMQVGLYCVKKMKQAKILGVREPRGEGKDVGFLPGSFDAKVGPFFAPLAQQIGGQRQLESYMEQGYLETNIPHYMKGTTYDSTIIIVDEAEDLSEEQIRLIGTRVGQKARIFWAGDYGQSLTNKSASNPLLKMCNEFKGDPKFGCIQLEEDVRSEVSKMYTTLFKN